MQVTHSVAILARWMAADLYLREVDALRFELSQNHASDEVRLPDFNTTKSGVTPFHTCIIKVLAGTLPFTGHMRNKKAGTSSQPLPVLGLILISQDLTLRLATQLLPGETEVVSCAGVEAGKRDHQSAACAGRQPCSTGPWAGMCTNLTPHTQCAGLLDRILSIVDKWHKCTSKKLHLRK